MWLKISSQSLKYNCLQVFKTKSCADGLNTEQAGGLLLLKDITGKKIRSEISLNISCYLRFNRIIFHLFLK